jgi:hypothetical protein
MALVLVFIAVLSWVSHDAGSLTSSETIRRRPKLTLQDAA